MSRNEFLARRGLYLKPDFLSATACASLTQVMLGSPSEPAKIYDGGDVEATVDESTRRALSVDLQAEDSGVVELAFDGLREELSRHFRRPLSEREPSEYLVYGPGSFFAPHRDRATKGGALLEVDHREVAAVVFVSPPQGVDAAGYSGGELRFYGLLDGSEWGDVGFGCDATPGLLVAFPADTLHEVAPVTAGHRCTIVTWFR